MQISDLKWRRAVTVAAWNADGRTVHDSCGTPLTAVCELRDHSSVALVESIEELGPRNALALNGDGQPLQSNRCAIGLWLGNHAAGRGQAKAIEYRKVIRIRGEE